MRFNQHSGIENKESLTSALVPEKGVGNVASRTYCTALRGVCMAYSASGHVNVENASMPDEPTHK